MKIYRLNKWLMVALCSCTFLSFQIGSGHQTAAAAIIIDHTCTNLASIPQPWLQSAKNNLHIAYGHTSHGSQLTTGMTGLVGFINGHGLGLTFPNNFFAWNNGGIGGALDLHDSAMEGDVGYYPDWVNNTRGYLGSPNPITGRGTTNPDVNVIIWSWCGQVSGKYAAGTLSTEYINPMVQLEEDYFGVMFVYMTGHVDHGDDANNKAANNVIRAFCNTNNKILYDFADIESYDPDGTFYEFPNDSCDYYASASGALLGNWATAWQASHTEDLDWYSCGSQHSQPLNANRKAYAAWWLWARLTGWNGVAGPTYTISGTILHDGAGLQYVVLQGLPGNPVTDSAGVYSIEVNEAWSDTVTPTLTGYNFSPSNRSYPTVTEDQTGQDYTATHQSSVKAPGDGGGGGGGGCFINASINGLSLGLLSFALLLLMTVIRYVKTSRKAPSRSTGQF